MAAPMSLAEMLGLGIGFRLALAVGLAVALLGALAVTPKALRKLRGAGIVGQDRHKPGAPEVPEMGGLAVFIAFNMGVFAVLSLAGLAAAEHAPVLASLIVISGACITGVLDDLVDLRQRFKAFIPLAFALPLTLYAPDTRVFFPFAGWVDLGLLYPLVLVPFAVTCASNGFNMLEGFNGLGAGLGIILAAAISAIALLGGNLLGLALLLPLVGALGGFLYYNAYPARIFPGDTMTLFVGAALASGAILSKVEFFGFVLFVPHVIEFFLKAKSGFRAQSFATDLEGETLRYQGPTRSLTHLVMRRWPSGEGELVARMWLLEGLFALAVVGGFALTQAPLGSS